MSFPWQAERTIEPELAFELIKIQFPFLKPLQLTLLGVGWDNSAFLLDKKYVFRFLMYTELFKTHFALGVCELRGNCLIMFC